MAESRRRRANSAHKRVHRHVVRLDAGEEERLRRMADSLDVTVPRLLVESALDMPARGPRMSVADARALTRSVRQLRAEVIRVGVNLNQIARVANANGVVVPGRIVRLEAELRPLVDRLDELARDADARAGRA